MRTKLGIHNSKISGQEIMNGQKLFNEIRFILLSLSGLFCLSRSRYQGFIMSGQLMFTGQLCTVIRKLQVKSRTYRIE